MKTYRRVLTIAGSDSGGGAGIQADLKTFSALGCYGMSVITALTAQNTVRVTAIHPVPPTFIAEQIDAVIEDIGVDAVKIGMLHSSDVIRVVAERLRHHGVGNVVLDPVMVAKSGDRLLQADAEETLRGVLIPLATVLAPNVPEAAALLGRPIDDLDDMRGATKALADRGPRAVLLKGGHLGLGHSPDVLYDRDTDALVVLEGERVDTENTHGTGCTLSSAIAAFLARGCDVPEAVSRAKAYTGAAIAAGADYRLGHGHGPVHHFHGIWE